MKVAYLVNQYPKTSHSFIRREIEALENAGVSVSRFSVRRVQEPLPDAADQREATRTTVLLDGGARSLLLALLRQNARSPVRFARAVASAAALSRTSDRGPARHFAYLAEACILAEALEAAQVEHLHAHFGTNPAAVAFLCHQLGGPPYSFTVHGPDEFDQAPDLALRRKTSDAAFVVAISAFCRSQLCRLVAFEDWEKIRVVRCGLGATLLGAEATDVPTSNRFLCVGRLSEQKGHLVLLDAFRAVTQSYPDAQLVLAGDGELRETVKRRIAELGLERSVTITGWVSEQRVIDEIRACRAFVLPSFAEGLPVVLMEALALGRPVVSTFVAGIPELVRPNENGWLVPAGDVDGLVAALREVLNTPPPRLSAMGRRGRELVLEQHDVQKSGALLKDLFLSVGGGAARRG